MSKKIRRTGRFFTYMVECSDKTYYTGFTPDIDKRIKTHNSGRGAKYTRGRRPVKLIWFREYKHSKTALQEEKRIKSLTREQKEALINGTGKRRKGVRLGAGTCRQHKGRSCRKV